MISFSDAQLRAVCEATRQIRYEDRRRYLLLIANELDQCDGEIGDGSVARAVATAIQQFGATQRCEWAESSMSRCGARTRARLADVSI